jgi:endoglucanase
MNRSEALSQLLALGGPKTDNFTNGIFGLGMNDVDTAEQLLVNTKLLRTKGYVGDNYLRVAQEWSDSLKAPATPAPVPSASVPQLYAAGNQALDRGHVKLGSTPQAVWVNGWGDIDRAKDVAAKAKAAGQVPQFVAYFIPNRDNGQASAGGASSSEDYRNWGRALADAVLGTNAIVDLEPDALTLYNGTPSSRYEDLGYVGRLLLNAGCKVFLSAGHSAWLSAEDIISRSNKVGFVNFTGYSLNDSNCQPLENEVALGERLWAMTNKAYVVDTSRAGAGTAPLLKAGMVVNGNKIADYEEWQNQPNRTFGPLPTLQPTKGPHCYAYLFIKHVGEADGNWNPYKRDWSAPNAGLWFDDYASEVERNSGW